MMSLSDYLSFYHSNITHYVLGICVSAKKNVKKKESIRVPQSDLHLYFYEYKTLLVKVVGTQGFCTVSVHTVCI